MEDPALEARHSACVWRVVVQAHLRRHGASHLTHHLVGLPHLGWADDSPCRRRGGSGVHLARGQRRLCGHHRVEHLARRRRAGLRHA